MALFCVVAGVFPVSGAETKVLSGHVPPVVKRLNAIGRMAPAKELRLAIGLPLSDPAGLDQLIAELYDPASPSYHQFLTADQLAARFGPTERDYEAVKQFARTNGLTVITGYSNRLVLDVAGPAGSIEKAFHVALRTYQHPSEARQFFAPDSDPTVAVGLPVADIQGLSDFSRPHPRIKPRDLAGIVAQNGSAPDGSGSYFGDDFRNAYAPATTLSGSGQSVGLLQFDGFYTNDIAAYATAAGGGRTNIVVQTVLVDGYNGVPTTGANSGNIEVSLDIEMAMAMAPGLSSIVVFEAGPTGNPNDVLNAMLSYSNSVQNLSCSWGWSGGPTTTLDSIFKNMQAAGQSFFNASGDSDAFTTGSASANGVDNPSLDNAPSSSPYITEVGGTTLTVNGGSGSYYTETVWNWGLDGSSYVGSSGGISSYYTIPNWQATVPNLAGRGGSTVYRNLPDVALTADNVYVVYGGAGAGSGGVGSTSCAAPLWAGFMALVNEQASFYGRPVAGFINPAIYSIANGANYSACFNDVTTGNNMSSSSPSLFNAAVGYDLCTGLGSPNGAALPSALVGAPDALGVPAVVQCAFSGPATGPFNQPGGTFLLTNSSAAPVNWVLLPLPAWLTPDATSGTVAANQSANLTVSLNSAVNNLALGNYSGPVLVSNLTTHAVLHFNCTLQVTQPLAVPPATVFKSGGSVGGPFVPASATITLTNFSGSAMAWALVNTSAWFSVSSTKGLVSAFGSATMTVSVAPAAVSLTSAVYNASLVLTNALGTFATVPVTLSVGQPVVQNGGFESGNLANWTLSGNTSSIQMVGNNANYVHSGNDALALGPPYTPGFLSQNLITAPGQNYVLSLWLRNPTGTTPILFQVYWNGAMIFAQTNITYRGWTNLQFVVTAPGSSTVLQFGFQHDPYYFGLDDISAAPLAPLSFRSSGRTANNFQFSFGVTNGFTYQVQYCTNLAQPAWVNLGGAITAKSTSLSVTDANAFVQAPERLYRVLVTH